MVSEEDDLTCIQRNWRKTRRKCLLVATFCCILLHLPQPQNAMPVPKIENNSLTSAMVSCPKSKVIDLAVYLCIFQQFFTALLR